MQIYSSCLYQIALSKDQKSSHRDTNYPCRGYKLKEKKINSLCFQGGGESFKGVLWPLEQTTNCFFYILIKRFFMYSYFSYLFCFVSNYIISSFYLQGTLNIIVPVLPLNFATKLQIDKMQPLPVLNVCSIRQTVLTYMNVALEKGKANCKISIQNDL